MKKILFATTALVATAGVAAADVSFGGFGRFGAFYNGTNTNLSHRFNMNIDASTEADNGLTFSARVRIRANAGEEAAMNGARFGMSTGGFSLQVGNISGALESMPNYWGAEIGFTGFMYANPLSTYGVTDVYTSPSNGDNGLNDRVGRNGIRLAYSAGDFSGVLSHSNTGGEERVALSVAYSFSDWTVALGRSDSNNNANDWTLLTVGGKVGPAALTLAVEDGAAGTGWGIGADIEVGAATNVVVAINSTAAGVDSYGLGFRHDLGGGASLRGGVADMGGTTIGDLGVVFNF